MLKDFILYIRDDQINQPTAVTSVNQYGEQTILVNMLPDLRAPKLRNRFLSKFEGSQVIDNDKAYNYEAKKVEEEDDEEIVEPKLSEYIFLIDRSGSMEGQRIDLAVQALKLFVHSLPLGSKFNIVSYGCTFTSLFPESQTYDEESLHKAITALSSFSADMGGTEIYEPLKHSIEMPLDPCLPRHIYLLTDGEVINTEDIV